MLTTLTWKKRTALTPKSGDAPRSTRRYPRATRLAAMRSRICSTLCRGECASIAETGVERHRIDRRKRGERAKSTMGSKAVATTPCDVRSSALGSEQAGSRSPSRAIPKPAERESGAPREMRRRRERTIPSTSRPRGRGAIAPWAVAEALRRGRCALIWPRVVVAHEEALSRAHRHARTDGPPTRGSKLE